MIQRVVHFCGETVLDIPCDKILSSAIGKLNKCIIIGVDKKDKIYFASSIGEQSGGIAETNLLIDFAKNELMMHLFDEDAK